MTPDIGLPPEAFAGDGGTTIVTWVTITTFDPVVLICILGALVAAAFHVAANR